MRVAHATNGQQRRNTRIWLPPIEPLRQAKIKTKRRNVRVDDLAKRNVLVGEAQQTAPAIGWPGS